MRKALANKLKVFLHCRILQILHVLITRVKEELIQNEHVQRMFYDIPRINNMIAVPQMDFIGKIVRAHPQSPGATDKNHSSQEHTSSTSQTRSRIEVTLK